MQNRGTQINKGDIVRHRNNMIHEAYTTGIVFQRYYKIVHPDRNYSAGQALRQSKQDNKIDIKVLRSVFDQILREQKKLLKRNN